MEDGAPHSLKSVTFSPCIFFLKLLKIARMMTRDKSPWTSFLKWGLLWNLCQGYQQELVKNSWSYQPLSRQFTGARRGARAAKRLISLMWHHFLVFLLLNHHFPNEPVRGQYLLMTFPVFGFCCFPWLLPSPLVIVKGRQPVCSMCNRFPLPHSLWPGAATFIAQLGFPLCTPLGRAEATREVLTSGNLKPRNKDV